MKRFYASCLFLALTTLAGCQPDQSQTTQTFNQQGIRFQHPGNWSANDAEIVDSSAVSVSCQKDGLNDSGLITISCFNDSLALSTIQEIYRNQLDSTALYRMAGVKFAPVRPGHFGRYQTLQSQFTMSMMGVPHSGRLDAFYYKGHTLMILRQQADEDSAKNKSGFALITKTLDLRPGR